MNLEQYKNNIKKIMSVLLLQLHAEEANVTMQIYILGKRCLWR